MKISHIILSTLLLMIFNTAHSQDGLTQSQLNQAASQHFGTSDYMLNKAYAQLMGVLSEERKEKLKTSQRTWIKFRDSEADFISGAYGNGSMRPLIHAQVLIRLTEQRTSELTRIHLNEITP